MENEVLGVRGGNEPDVMLIYKILNQRQNDIVPTIFAKGPIGREDSYNENVVIDVDKAPGNEGRLRMRIRVLDAGWKLCVNMGPEKFLDVIGIDWYIYSDSRTSTVIELLQELEEDNVESIAKFYEHFDCAIWSKDYIDDMIDIYHMCPNICKNYGYTSQPTIEEFYDLLCDRMEQDLAGINSILQSAVSRLRRRLYDSMM